MVEQEHPRRSFATLVELLSWRAQQQPQQRGFTFLADGEHAEEHCTYAELDEQARSIAAALQERGAAGKPALLLYPPGLQYIAAFFGCLYAGAIAIPAYPPNPARLERTFARLRAMVDDAPPAVVMTTGALLDLAAAIAAQQGDFGDLPWMASDQLDPQYAAAWQPTPLDSSTLAFLQYTSGSTAVPKGVMLTHGNLLHNLSLIEGNFEHSASSRGVIWLPPYHDMGLIGGILQPLYAGFPVTLLSPVSFLQRPFRWLSAISRYQATTSGGPNFAYDLCVRKTTPEQRAELDLSHWEVAFTGAEPVRAETIRRFSEAFAPSGFRPEAFYACYGLAEATLFVTGGYKTAPPVVHTFDAAGLEQHAAVPSAAPEARALVGNGRVSPGQQLAIVDPQSRRRCPEGTIGEVWLAGPSVAQGYWNRPEETEHTFRAQLAGEQSARYLRTGDLGFLLGDELFVTGRLKDLLIIRGRNHYPQDIELTVERSHAALRPGCCAAFSVQHDGEERLVVVQEVDRTHRQIDVEELASLIRQSVMEQHELHVYAVALIKHGSTPKTSSGKIQRQLCKARFQEGALELLGTSLHDDQPGDWEAIELTRDLLLATAPDERRPLLERYLRTRCAQALHVHPERIAATQPLSALGLDSLMAVELQYELETALGLVLPMARLLEGPSIVQLAAELLAALEPADLPAQGAVLARGASHDQEHPLSYGQRALWFLHQLEPQSAAYHIAGAVRIDRALDLALLRQACDALVRRHHSLHVAFPLRVDTPVQRLSPEPAIDLGVEEVAGWSDELLRERLEEEAHQPFDLERGPLLRLRLFRRSPDEHFLLLVLHHIIADFWSLAVFVRELDLLYQAALSGQPLELPPLPVEYRDYVAWQQALIDGPEGERLWEYWQRQLGGELPSLSLPTDRPRPALRSSRGSSRALTIDDALSQRLKLLCEQRGVTLYTALLSAFYALLFRYTEQTDLIVGSATAGRGRAQLQGLIGYFVNPVALRVQLSGELSLEALVERVRQVVLEAFKHQEYPFPLLVERLQPSRDLSRTPLVQVMFNFQQTLLLHEQGMPAFALQQPGARLALPALPMESVGVQQHAAQFDLQLVMAETDGGLGALCQYNSDLFDAATIDRLLEHFQLVLRALVAQPGQTIGALPLLLPDEAELLRGWNDTALAVPRERCLHELIEAQAQRRPDATALVFEEQRLSYAELDARANQLAHELRELGAGPETLVGLYAERSPLLIVGLLAILKAGAAYLPLDPAYPLERLTFMLQDSGAPILLTDARLVASLPGDGIRRVRLDADWPEIARRPAHRPTPRVGPANLAYTIYTSGSTGDPKGVQISHGAVVNFLVSMAGQPGLSEQDRLLSVTTLSFDIAALELFLPLICGAQVILASREVAADGVQLAGLLERSRATVMQATPATWRLLLEAGWGGSPELRMLCGGEALPHELALRLVEHGAELWNMYGPTETTIWSTVAQLDPSAGPITLGRPIANTQIYLLNAALQQVPVGVAGELYIGGDGLSRGYLGRPALTAERFSPNPFAQQPGERIYRTGDLARFRSDGSIEYLGRVDFQVKVRGFRIELGEIERRLAQHPHVGQAVVVAQEREGWSGEKQLVAYLVAEQPPAIGELREFLKQQLPDYMVPSFFLFLAELPLTPNGKVDRKALPLPEGERPHLETAYLAPRSAMERTIAAIWQAVLQLDHVGVHDNFFDLGGHSLLLGQVHSRLRGAFEHELSMVDLFKYPTVSALAGYLEGARAGGAPGPAPSSRAALRKERARQASGAIAIVGMAGRFPGAESVDAFWANLQGGVESISFFSDEELRAAGVDDALLRNPSYVKAKGALDGIGLFDAAFFGFSPREAEAMDPQHRLLLECAWTALEHAGYDSARYPGRIGVYAGAGINTYLLQLQRASREAVGRYQLFIGNDKDFVPTRISYKLDLRGPSVNVQTACSSSLVAVHLACQSLLSGESDMALAGAVAVGVPEKEGYLYEPGGIQSPDGHCRAFDANAQGTVFGSGMGMVVLKRLEDALADNDTVHAVIKGSAINNDGALKAGYTAPSVDGQAEVIAEALALAGVDAESIGYVEAHGTGTALGDPIELAALSQVYHASTQRQGFCAMGSVKSNIGHLDTAAGVAGLIKTALALKHQQLPPSLHFEQPNPKIDFAGSPFYVNAQLQPWAASGTPRRAGVSSFGIGGTNAHVILEEAPPQPATSAASRSRLLLLSAKTASALETATQALATHLRHNPELDLADVAYTLQVGRRAFAHRRALVCDDLDEAIALLEGGDPARDMAGSVEVGQRGVVFMFPGQGAQYPGMGAQLYQEEPVFRAAVDRCAQLLGPILGLDLRTLLYSEQPDDQLRQQLNQTKYTQPALFVIEYALAQQWMAWGVRPQAMIGHSIGEYVAACLAGVFSLEDALRLVCIRGALMQSAPTGAMLAVSLPAQELEQQLRAFHERLSEQARTTPGLALAAVNGPRSTVVGGPAALLEAFEATLAQQAVACSRLHTSHAFHSALMDGIVETFTAEVRRVRLNAPALPYISNVSGSWITAAEATDASYWGRQLRQPVQFLDGVRLLLQEPDCVYLEVGPGIALGALVRQHPGEPVALSSLRHPKDQQRDLPLLLATAGKLWLAGVEPAWPALYGEERPRRIPLPTYPFERQHYWLADHGPAEPAERGAARRERGEWLYAPLWKQSPPPLPVAAGAEPEAPSCWLMFLDECGIAAQLAERLEAMGQVVLRVTAGEQLEQLSERALRINPGQPEDYVAAVAALRAYDQLPVTIVHAWNVGGDEAADQLAGVERALERSFFSPLYLAQALEKAGLSAPVRLELLSSAMQHLGGERDLTPAKASLLGPSKVVGQEYPSVSCRSIDLILPAPESAEGELLVERLLADLLSPDSEMAVAYRGVQRWVQTVELMSVPPTTPERPAFRQGGVYLITGGLGGIGMVLARHLVQTAGARVVLTGASPLPRREEWARWLASHDEHDAVSRKLRGLQELEALGGEVLALSADVTSLAQMREVVSQARQRFGALHGVIHAAGVAGGGIISFKSADAARRVLAPKITGALVLQALPEWSQLELVVLCSSINAVIGGFGQVDYCAANAALDALAQRWASRRGPRVVSISWDRWAEVGMAVNTAVPAEFRQIQAALQHEPSGHPLLGARVTNSAEQQVYVAEISADSQWVLAEHLILGSPTVPGTTYLELVRAACHRLDPDADLELRDIVFLTPLVVPQGATTQLRTSLARDGDRLRFAIASRAGQGLDGEPWIEHATGSAQLLAAEPAAERCVEAIMARCEGTPPALHGTGAEEHAFLKAGPRWQSLRQVFLGQHEGLARLELDERFAADLEHFELHPALLDVAAGAVKYLGEGDYLPLAYQRVRVRGPLSPVIYSHITYDPAAQRSKETLTCDLVITDADGVTLVEIAGFSMRRVGAEAVAAFQLRQGHGAAQPAQTPAAAQPAQAQTGGLRPTEAVELLDQILAGTALPHVIVSMRDLPGVVREANKLTTAHVLEQLADQSAARPAHARPNVKTAYVAPVDEIEQTIGEIWQRMLGLAEVGVHDNFFELGGTSLTGIQVVAELKERLGVDIPVVTIFEAPTVRALAEHLRPSQDQLAPFQRSLERADRKLKRKRVR